MDTTDSTVATGAIASGTGSAPTRSGKSSARQKRKGSRKEERKNARTAKKQRNLNHRIKKSKDASADASIDLKPLNSEKSTKSSNEVKRNIRAHGDQPHTESNMDDGKNSLFYDMLRKDGLLEGNRNDGGAKPKEDDEDDRTIREMRKLLKLKNDELKDEGDGLDFIMGYKSDLPEQYKTIMKEEDNDVPEEDDDDEEFEDYLGGMGLDTYPDSDDADLDSNQGDIDLDSLRADVDFGHGDSDGDDSTENTATHRKGHVSNDEDESEEDDNGDSSNAESDDASGEDDIDTEKKLTTPAQYITRADAYGDQSSGAPDAAKSLMAHQRYIPPAQRRKLESAAAGGSGASLQASRQVKGLLNRLNAANMTKILKEIEMVYRQNSRNEITKTITTFVLDACMNKAATLEHLLMVYAGSVAALHHVIGVEVTGHFLQDLATQYSTYYNKALSASQKKKASRKGKDRASDAGSSAQEDEFYDKECANLATLLSYLYCYRVVHSTLIMDVLKMHCESFTDLDVELLLVIL